MAAWDSQAMAEGVPISMLVAVPGGNPVTEVPGDRPRAPLMTVNPELVTVVAAQTPKSLVVAPRASPRVAVGAQIRATTAARRTIGDMLRSRGMGED